MERKRNPDEWNALGFSSAGHDLVPNISTHRAPDFACAHPGYARFPPIPAAEQSLQLTIFPSRKALAR
jgi:hypothetical protein